MAAIIRWNWYISFLFIGSEGFSADRINFRLLLWKVGPHSRYIQLSLEVLGFQVAL